MLPAGLAAQPADRLDHHHLTRLHPPARTVLRLLVGACSCDLVRQRHADTREDERMHRARARRAGRARTSLIAELERHRLGALVSPPPNGWPHALALFVAEHARNAGDTLYLLRLDHSEPGGAELPVRRIPAAEVVARPLEWLADPAPVIVGR